MILNGRDLVGAQEIGPVRRMVWQCPKCRRGWGDRESAAVCHFTQEMSPMWECLGCTSWYLSAEDAKLCRCGYTAIRVKRGAINEVEG